MKETKLARMEPEHKIVSTDENRCFDEGQECWGYGLILEVLFGCSLGCSQDVRKPECGKLSHDVDT